MGWLGDKTVLNLIPLLMKNASAGIILVSLFSSGNGVAPPAR